MSVTMACVCGGEFTPKRRHGRYCSPRCRLDAWAARQNGRQVALTHLSGPFGTDPRFYRPARRPSARLRLAEPAGTGLEPAVAGARLVDPPATIQEAWNSRPYREPQRLACGTWGRFR